MSEAFPFQDEHNDIYLEAEEYLGNSSLISNIFMHILKKDIKVLYS